MQIFDAKRGIELPSNIKHLAGNPTCVRFVGGQGSRKALKLLVSAGTSIKSWGFGDSRDGVVDDSDDGRHDDDVKRSHDIDHSHDIDDAYDADLSDNVDHSHDIDYSDMSED